MTEEKDFASMESIEAMADELADFLTNICLGDEDSNTEDIKAELLNIIGKHLE